MELSGEGFLLFDSPRIKGAGKPSSLLAGTAPLRRGKLTPHQRVTQCRNDADLAAQIDAIKHFTHEATIRDQYVCSHDDQAKLECTT